MHASKCWSNVENNYRLSISCVLYSVNWGQTPANEQNFVFEKMHAEISLYGKVGNLFKTCGIKVVRNKYRHVWYLCVLMNTLQTWNRQFYHNVNLANIICTGCISKKELLTLCLVLNLQFGLSVKYSSLTQLLFNIMYFKNNFIGHFNETSTFSK